MLLLRSVCVFGYQAFESGNGRFNCAVVCGVSFKDEGFAFPDGEDENECHDDAVEEEREVDVVGCMEHPFGAADDERHYANTDIVTGEKVREI